MIFVIYAINWPDKSIENAKMLALLGTMAAARCIKQHNNAA